MDNNRVKNLVREIDGEVMLDTRQWNGGLKTASELTTEEVQFVLEVLYSYQNGFWEITDKLKGKMN